VGCHRDYRDPNRNPRVSWAWDTRQIAIARRQCGGSMLDVWTRETGRMWRRPMGLDTSRRTSRKLYILEKH
jgi:hypothetical protein